MSAADHKPDRDEWRLGTEPAERHEGAAVLALAVAREKGPYDRLERPVMLVTVERLYWAIIAVYAVISRCVFLGARPLGPTEARLSFGAYETMHLGVMPGPPAAWLQLLDAAMLAAFGPSDFAARLLFAVAGIALVLIPLAFRRSIGRVGALAMATVIALSPSMAYFARSAATAEAALLVALVVVAMFIGPGSRASTARVGALGGVIGMALGANAQNLVVGAIFLLGLLILGVAKLTTTDGAWTSARIWWQQYSGSMLLTVLIALIVWATTLTGFFSHPLWSSLAGVVHSNWAPAEPPTSRIGLYLAPFALYEFLIAIIAIIGALAVIANLAGARTALGIFVLIWTAAIIACFPIGAYVRGPIIEILLPAALLGGIGIEALSHTRSWRVMFYPIAALALVTLYIQIATNFVFVAPDPAEAQWARHTLLFWTEPTTADNAREEILQAIGAGAERARTAWIADDSPVMRWYLRDLSPAENAAGADLIAGMRDAPPGWPVGIRKTFDLESWWQPSFAELSARQVIRFLLIGRAWQKLDSHEVTILTRAANHPTTIYVPAAPPSESVIATAVAPIPGKGASAQPAAAIVASPHPTP